jgi:WD40 repeat protein
MSVTFSPDGEKIVSGSQDHTLRLWGVSTCQTIGSPFQGHSHWVMSVAFSPDREKIVSGSEDHTLCLWDVSTGQTIGSPFKGHSDGVKSVAFLPDGKTIVSCSGDHMYCLWDVESGQPIHIKGHHGAICISLRHEIVSAFSDNTIHVWSAHTGQPIKSLHKGTMAETISLTSSLNGSQFAAASSDGSIHLWDADSHKLVTSYSMDCINNMSSMIFSSDGKQLMTFFIDSTAHSWDTTSGKLLESSQPSDTSLLTVLRSEDDKTLLRWFPVNNPDFGHWAYIDSTLIRRDRDGLLTVFDMGDIKREWNPSQSAGDLALPNHPDMDKSKNPQVGSTTIINNVGGSQYNFYN